MKNLLCILLWLLLAAVDLCGQGFGNSIAFQGAAALRPAAGGGASCPSIGSPDVATADPSSYDDAQQVATSTDFFYIGMTGITNAVDRAVCRVRVYWGVGAGTPSSETYVCKIWTLSGTSLDAVISNGTSDNVAGPSANGWGVFTFASNPTMTASTSYAITIECNGGVTANRAEISFDTPTSINGQKAVWNSAKAQDSTSATYDMGMEIYWYD